MDKELNIIILVTLLMLLPRKLSLKVCLFACLFLFKITQRTEWIFLIFFMWLGNAQRKKRFNFGNDLDHTVDTKSPEFSTPCTLGVLSNYLYFSLYQPKL